MKGNKNEHKNQNNYINNQLSHNNYNQEESNPRVDLKEMDATEETMSKYTYPKEFLKLDLDKIREFIEILEEHYQNLIEQENIQQAKSAKQRLILLKNLEKEKMKKEAKIIYSNQCDLVEDKMNEELNSYIETTNKEFDSLLKAFESQDVEILKTQKQELEDFHKNFEKLYETKKPKPSKQILNWIKIRDFAIKQNKFDKVEEASKEINKLQKKDKEKFELEKEKKLNVEIAKINKRHEIEKNALQMKKNSIIDMFNQTKNKNIEQIQKKYEAKMKELKNYQNFEMSNFDKITKGIAKPCSRIQNIVSSTTGIKEDDKDENEIKGGGEDEDGAEEEDNQNENDDNNADDKENEKNEELELGINKETKTDEEYINNEQKGFKNEENEEMEN
jgi:hypothetical protein